MIERIKENIAFIFVCITLIVGFMIPLGDTYQQSKFENLTVPRFSVPVELKKITNYQANVYPEINKDVLLGELAKPVIVEKPVVVKKEKEFAVA